MERTLIREIFEEVGIEISIEGYVNSTSFVTASGLNVIDLVFLCQHKSGEPYAKSAEEVDDVIWLTTSDILSHTALPDYLKENIALADLVRRNQLIRS